MGMVLAVILSVLDAGASGAVPGRATDWGTELWFFQREGTRLVVRRRRRRSATMPPMITMILSSLLAASTASGIKAKRSHQESVYIDVISQAIRPAI
jgi:hypothetical protein